MTSAEVCLQPGSTPINMAARHSALSTYSSTLNLNTHHTTLTARRSTHNTHHTTLTTNHITYPLRQNSTTVSSENLLKHRQRSVSTSTERPAASAWFREEQMAHGVAATSASGTVDGMIVDVVQHEDVTDVIASYDPDATPPVSPRAPSATETLLEGPNAVVACRWDDASALLTPALARSVNLGQWLSQPFVPFGTTLPVGGGIVLRPAAQAKVSMTRVACN